MEASKTPKQAAMGEGMGTVGRCHTWRLGDRESLKGFE